LIIHQSFVLFNISQMKLRSGRR